MVSTLEKPCRLDKWLWAARFFKTRSLAADAVDAGKVRVDGLRAKNAKEVKPSMMVAIKHKDLELEVEVLAVSHVRKGAPEAALLYRETPASVVKREQMNANKTNEVGARDRGAGRPTKRQLRDIRKFTGIKY